MWVNNLSWVALTAGISLVGCSIVGVRNYPQPNYTVLEAEGNLELRRYEPLLAVETWVEGTLAEARNTVVLDRRIGIHLPGRRHSNHRPSYNANVTRVNNRHPS